MRQGSESRPEISLVIPVYNEEENLPVLAAEIRAALEPLGRTYEVILVDDGSTDSSPEVMHRLALEGIPQYGDGRINFF